MALNAYDVLSGRQDIHHTGGAEVQQWQIASWLVHQGYAVSFVTLDHGQPDGIALDGIHVYKAYAKEDGLRGVRFLHPRWSGLWAAMARADAEVYYQRGAEHETGQVALWCRLHQRRFIFAAASDPDCDCSLPALTSWKERILYRLGLRLAHGVIAQTKTQQTLLRRSMGVESVLVRSCGWNPTDPSPRERPSPDGPGSLRVLWVGRISAEKRLEWLLAAAARCPEITFQVVGGPRGDSDYGTSLAARAATLPNVTMHHWVPHAEMAKYYQRCHVLCCTSVYEGFPNTFLEAWGLGLPVISTVDPDGVIAENGLGWVVQDVEAIVACLQQLRQAPELRREAADAATRYYGAHHTPEVCLPAFVRMLLAVAGGEKTASGALERE